MHFTLTTIATMAAAATANLLPRADYGGWNITISHTGGADRARTETVTGVYANAQLTDNVPVTCHYQGPLNGEGTKCDPESFSYVFEGAGYEDGDLYQLTLSQTVEISGTEVTVKGVSDKFKTVSDGVTGKGFSAKDVIVEVSTAVA